MLSQTVNKNLISYFKIIKYMFNKKPLKGECLINKQVHTCTGKRISDKLINNILITAQQTL